MLNTFLEAEFKPTGLDYQVISALSRASRKVRLFKMLLTLTIFPENGASIELHRKCGFRVVGLHEKLGQMEGIWRDVVLMERRSKIVGV